MQFKVGDKVKVIDENSEGIIVQIPNSLRLIVEIDGFDYEYKPTQLLKSVDEQTIVEVNYKVISEKESMLNNKVSKPHHRKGEVREVDLHIHQIIDSTINLSNSEMLIIQIERFRRELNRAIVDKVAKIIFIHGVGEGVLRAELRRQLKLYEGVTYQDASYLEYGNGATEVVIYQNY